MERDASHLSQKKDSLGPFDFENKMVITVIVNAPDGFLSIVPVLEIDESEAA